MALFELEWMGGTAERLFAQHRGDRIERIDWSSLRTTGLTDAQRDGLRTAWTRSAHQEWCAAGAFSTLLTHLIRAGAPVDLIGMAGRFVADEMVHVELASRLAMAFGGGVPLEVDPLAVHPTPVANDPLVAACELALRVSCVGETFSLPVLAHEQTRSQDPVLQAVLRRIVVDEAPHALVGWLVLDWAVPRLGTEGIEHLHAVAADAVEALLPLVHASPDYLPFFRGIFQTRIQRPLSHRGLHVAASWAA